MIDKTTGLPGLPKGFYWFVERDIFGNPFSVFWELQIKQKRRWWLKDTIIVKQTILNPDRKDSYNVMWVPSSGLILSSSLDALRKFVTLTEYASFESDSKEIMGAYPPKSLRD